MNKGTSRQSRVNKALSPDYIAMDERSMQDMIASTLSYAKKVNYYSDANTPAGDWQSFFLKDPIFVFATITKTDITLLKEKNDTLEDFNALNQNEKDLEIVEKYKNVTQLVGILHTWSELLVKSSYEGSLVQEVQDLKKAIQKNIEEMHPVLHFIENDLVDDSSIQGVLKKLTSDFDCTIDHHNTLDQKELHKDVMFYELKDQFDAIYGSLIFFKEKAFNTLNEQMMYTANHPPHIGLLIAFYKLFHYSQQEINTLTKKHLDYYYREILQIKQFTNTQKHTAMIACTLKRNEKKAVVAQGEVFNFDIGAGQVCSFEVDTATQINHAVISDIKTIFKSTHEPFDSNYEVDAFHYNTFFKSDIVEKIHQLEQVVPESFRDYPLLFGEETNDLADLGFIISSPSLLLEKGVQEITIELKLTEDLFAQGGRNNQFTTLFEKELEMYLSANPDIHQKEKEAKIKSLKENIKIKILKQAFIIYITSDEGWKQLKYSKTTVDGTIVTIRIPLQALDEQLISFNAALHEGDVKTKWPCIKFLLNNEATYHPYIFLKDWALEHVKIVSSVSEVSQVKLSNSNGEIDSSIPFQPFGPLPEKGSFLRIQNPLILQKTLSSLQFSVSWSGLPQVVEGFKDYYSAYPQNITTASFKAFMAQTRNLDRSASTLINKEFELFETDVERYIKNLKDIKVSLEDFKFTNKILEEDGIIVPTNNSIYLILKTPDMAFGHGVFSQIYAKVVMQNSRMFKKAVALPNPPYTPVIDQLKINYTNTVKENLLRKQDEDTTGVSLIHVHPFGNTVVFPGSIKSPSYLLPQINSKGNLYIAMKDVVEGNIISIGFDLIPAVYLHTAIEVPKVSWYYLNNNQWFDLTEHVLEDETKGLLKSGVLKIKMPQGVQLDNTRLESGKFWIKASFDSVEEINSRVKKIFTQAVSLTSTATIPKAVFDDFEKNKKIRITAPTNKKIQEIVGPMDYKRQDTSEDDKGYYNRVSDLLRHKNRGVSNWDMERLILTHFKQIGKVRVYGRNQYPNELTQGSNVQVVLIPNNTTNGHIHSQGNTFDIVTLQTVKEFVAKYVSPYVNIEVCNPIFETVKVRCRVLFTDVYKSRYLRDTLNKELVHFLSPDLVQLDNDDLFERSFTKTEIFNFIETRSYVQKVTSFSVIQLIHVIDKHRIIDTKLIEAQNKDEQDSLLELKTISAYAILTSVPHHHIEIQGHIPDEDDEIEGIGDIAIGSDFIVVNKQGIYIED